MKALSSRTRRKYRILFTILFCVAVPFLFIYMTGYRFGSDWFNLVETGGIYVYSDSSDVKISVDGALARETNFFRRGAFVQDLQPGEYEITAEKQDFETWNKFVDVEGVMVTEASVFLVRSQPILEPVLVTTVTSTSTTNSTTKSTTTSATSSKQIAYLESVLLAGSTTLLSAKERDNITISFSTTTKDVIAEWQESTSTVPSYFCVREKIREKVLSVTSGKIQEVCSKKITIFDYLNNILTQPMQIEFYPGRNDVILVKNSMGIFAYEIDIRRPQAIRTVYKGKADLVVADGAIYIRANKVWYKVILD